VRIRVDPDKCQGHARCITIAAQLFEADDYGLSSARGDGIVPPELEDAARLAIANCPEYAIEQID
jgi:ferredoxin